MLDDEYVTQAVQSFLAEVNTSLPGTIISFDGTMAVCKPAIDKLINDGRICSAPQIISVPVVFPCGQNWRMGGPLVAGDGVLLVFSQRALEAWLDSGGRVPNEPRIFSVSDAIAIPGLNPISYYTQNKQHIDTTNFFIQMGSGVLSITPQGKLLLNFPAGVEIQGGNLTVDQTVVAQDCQAGGVSLLQHTHPVNGHETGAPNA